MIRNKRLLHLFKSSIAQNGEWEHTEEIYRTDPEQIKK
jgi:hypothetical protein